ncbi:MAG TPA: GPW/gp25 family protein [Thermoanaerobaculia bacterium]|nr:GPW/gp25 family protein [Thermoanaerobaculia bacterium]
MATTRKPHLGVGWAFPPKLAAGSLRFARYEEDVEQAVQIILLTSRGERVMLSEFGAGLRDYVFEPNSEATRARLSEAVRKALVDWEPRIDLEKVEVTEGDAPNVVLIHVDYVVRATNTSYNRVYPFYLLEETA